MFDSVSLQTLFTLKATHSNFIYFKFDKIIKDIKLQAGDNIDRYLRK